MGQWQIDLFCVNDPFIFIFENVRGFYMRCNNVVFGAIRFNVTQRTGQSSVRCDLAFRVPEWYDEMSHLQGLEVGNCYLWGSVPASPEPVGRSPLKVSNTATTFFRPYFIAEQVNTGNSRKRIGYINFRYHLLNVGLVPGLQASSYKKSLCDDEG